jgi:DNA polymerase-1
MKKKKLVIIDGHSLLHRAWHALPPLTTKKGLVVNAIFGYFSILFKILKDLQPDYLATSFDLGKSAARTTDFADYKAQRVRQEAGFYEQIPMLQEALLKMGIPIYTKEGFEADDVIGTITKQTLKENDDVEVYVVSSDNDLLQLVGDGALVYMPKIGVGNFTLYDEAGVKEKYDGLNPRQIIDYKALKGDSSDNIPGVPGVGDKTAINLIKEFGSIEKLYEILKTNPEKLKEKKELKFTDRIIKLLIDNEELAFKCQKLARLITDVPIDFKLFDAELKPFDMQTVNEICQEYEFFTLPDKVPTFLRGQNTNKSTEKTRPPEEKKNYRLIENLSDLKNFLTELTEKNIFAFDTETTGLDDVAAEIIGCSFSWKKNQGVFIYLNHEQQAEFLKEIKTVLENPKTVKIGHNLKFDWKIMRKYGIEMNGVLVDTMIASHLLNPDQRHHDLDHLAFSELKTNTTSFLEMSGWDGKSDLAELMKNLDHQKLSDYACADADNAFQLWEIFETMLDEKKLLPLFHNIEMPLMSILAEMEQNGIKIDLPYFANLEEKFSRELEKIDKQIFELAGEEFNINSPKQIKAIIFDKLEISTENIKKTKTGQSTAAGELEKLKGEHEIIDLILQHRHLDKLLSTYIKSLPLLVKADGKIHTSFNQTITRTGRLSSSNPNLQNIPIKDETGRAIRKGFLAEKGHVLISADYSQIELRIIASLAQDKEMINAFTNDEDIHASTAAKINDLPIDKVSKELRNKAKAINFGVMYGLSAFGLANQINISRGEAQEFIDKYFQLYTAIPTYFDKLVKFAQENGYVETLFGRRRYIPDINASVQMVRKAAERTAINTPIQGTAADLMKIAMINIKKELLDKNSDLHLLLQVHDELVFSAPTDKAEKYGEQIRKIMENIYKLAVPLIVNVEINERWGEMH